jgi:hypothetical protein
MFKRGLKWLVKATTKNKEDVKVIIDREFAVYAYDEGRLPEIQGKFAEIEMAKEKANYLRNFYENVVILGVQTDKIVEML